VPFVKVMPSPRTEANACYFYSGQANGLLRFISYHFEQESEVETSDNDALELIEKLTLTNPN
jgi:hypothetical protein